MLLTYLFNKGNGLYLNLELFLKIKAICVSLTFDATSPIVIFKNLHMAFNSSHWRLYILSLDMCHRYYIAFVYDQVSKSYRIIDWLVLDRTFKDHLV